MLRKIFLSVLGIGLLASCNTDFSVNGEYEEIAVVHFLLDQGQEYQFLKLNKTYLKEGDALEFAKDESLQYFDNVVAVVQEYDGSVLKNEWTLQDTLISNKKEGIFYAPDQKLYFFKTTKDGNGNYLNPASFYRLKITIDGSKVITGQTSLVSGVGIIGPTQNQTFSFADNDVNLNGYKSTPIRFSMGNAAMAKLQLKFTYVEYTSSADSTSHTLIWEVGGVKSSEAASNPSILAPGESFYEFIKAKVPIDANVTKRFVREIQIVLTAGSDDLNTYILTSAPASTLAQNKPTFSNLDGALGIFSSRVTVTQTKPYYVPPAIRAINQNSTKELCTGKYTGALKFYSDIPLDNNFGFYALP